VKLRTYGLGRDDGWLIDTRRQCENGGCSTTCSHCAAGGTEQDQPGGAPGSRPGKPFTNAGKNALDKANADANGGVNKCTKCGKEVVPGKQSTKKVTPPGNERQRDHIIPKSKGGSGTIENGDIKCRDCNIEKSDKIETSDGTNAKAD
jgi:hypothetical protein